MQLKETAKGTRTHPGNVGQLIEAQLITEILADEIPEFKHIDIVLPDENSRRVGQSIAAASLCPIK